MQPEFICYDTLIKYVIYKSKRLYYPTSYPDEQIVSAVSQFVIEQDKKSPHCYLPNDDVSVLNNRCVMDLGAAEANFSLDIIEYVRKIYIVEGDEKWLPALQATFAPWKDKVVVIKKYVDSYNHGDYCTIDSIVAEDENIDFIKADIEGFETKALFGASRVLKNRNIRLSICTYHNKEDAEVIQSFLERKGFLCQYTDGFLFRTNESLYYADIPDCRHGVLIARYQ